MTTLVNIVFYYVSFSVSKILVCRFLISTIHIKLQLIFKTVIIFKTAFEMSDTF